MKNSQNIPEEAKYLHTRANCTYVSIDTFFEDDANDNWGEFDDIALTIRSTKQECDKFAKLVKNYQSQNISYGIITSKSAFESVAALFNEDPFLTADQLCYEFKTAIETGKAISDDVPPDDPYNYRGRKYENGEYDEFFWFKRSTELSFFINNRVNVLSQLTKYNLN